jgi:anti-anti-sigma regulatory factor
MSDDSKTVAVDTAKLDAAIEVLKRVKDGDFSARVEEPFDDERMEALRDHLNGVLQEVEKNSDEYHERSMELAMGISECFQVLADVRQGRLEAQVSEATTSSEEELVAKLGKSLNHTVTEIREQMETIERQQTAIQELSTPILQLWDDVLAMPIIGLVDTRRSADIMERMLSEVVSQQSRFVILDITGVDVVDTRTADYFIKVIKAAELLGTQCFLTGIQPAVAQTLVEIGVDLSSIYTLRNLQEGLKECLRVMARSDKTVNPLKKPSPAKTDERG